MMEYRVHSSSIWLKNNMVHGINKPWTVKTSTEDLKNSELGKMLFAFMSWLVVHPFWVAIYISVKAAGMSN